MWRINKENGSGVALLVFLFVLLPFLNIRAALDPDLNPRLIAISAFCTLGIFAFCRNPIHIPASYKKIGIASIAVLIVSLISIFSSINPGDAIAEWLRIFIVYVFAIVSILILRKSNIGFEIIIRFVSVGVLIYCGFAILQTIPIIEAALDHKKYSISYELASTLSNKNFFSEVLTILLPFSVYGLLGDKRKFKVLHLFALILSAFFIVLLASIACWITILFCSLIVITVFFFTNSSSEKRIEKKALIGLVIGSVVLISIASVVVLKLPIGKTIKFKAEVISDYIHDPALLDQNVKTNNNSIFDRVLMIRNSLKMIADHPFLGAGLNNWKLLYTSYGVGGTDIITSGVMNFEHPHNDYLLVFSEQGVVGLIAYLSFFFFLFKAWKEKLKLKQVDRSLLFIVLYSVLAFMMLSCFSYPRSRIYTPIVLMFVISLLFSKNENEEKQIAIKPIYGILAGVLCLLCVIVSSIRLKSEIHAKNALIAKVKNNFARVIRETEKIDLFFYPVEMTSTSINWYRGMAFFYSGQIPTALNEYRKAILITPNHLRTMNDMATAYEQTGQQDSAIYYYKKALSISPDLNDSKFNLAATYYHQNKIDSAYQIINTISYSNLNIGPQENFVKFMSVILSAKIVDSLENSTDTVLINKMNVFLNDIPRTKKYIRTYSGKTIWPDVLIDTK